jgi:predicted MFS family arabinose efflux permease
MARWQLRQVVSLGPGQGSDFEPRAIRRPLGFLAATRLVINTATRFVYPFLPAIARGLGVPLTAAGVLVSARWISGLATPGVVTAVGGARHQRLVRLSLALFMVGSLVTAATNVYVGALVGFILMGVAKPVFDVTSQAYISDRVPYEKRARYLAVFELTWAGALLIGAPLAGWLLDRAGWNAPFWVFGILVGVAMLVTGWALDPDSAAAKADRRSVVWHRSAGALIAVVGLFNLGAESMFVVYGAWLESGFGLSLAALGATAIVIGVAELGGEGATIAFTDRLGKRRAVAIGLVIAATGYLLVGAAQAQLVAGMAALAIGIGGFEFTIVSSIPLATEMAPMARTRYLAWSIVATSIGRATGAAVGPVLFEALGVGANAILAASANVVALVILLLYVRESGLAGSAAVRPSE